VFGVFLPVEFVSRESQEELRHNIELPEVHLEQFRMVGVCVFGKRKAKPKERACDLRASIWAP